jgi:glutaredoxin 3
MKATYVVISAICLFAFGFFVGEKKGSLESCNNSSAFTPKLFGEKTASALKVYTKITCPYCSGAKDLLSFHNIDYDEIDISDNDHLKTEMIKKANGRKTVPQIFIGDMHVGGFNDLQTIIETFKPCATKDTN